MIFKFTEVKKWQTKHSLITCRRALMQWERNRREDSEMKSYQYWFGFCKQKIVVHCFLTHSVFVASPRITLSDKCRHPRVHNLNDFIQTYLSFIVDFSLIVARFFISLSLSYTMRLCWYWRSVLRKLQLNFVDDAFSLSNWNFSNHQFFFITSFQNSAVLILLLHE